VKNLILRIKSALKTKTTELSLKEATLNDDGSFSGYASIWGEVDSYDEAVSRGAFKASLAAWKAKGKLPSMLWQHDQRKPIGVWTSMAEDAKGLRVEGQLALDTEQGKEAYALLKMGALDGLSIGYVATEWQVDKKTGVTTLDVIDLWEVSLVTFPAGPSARVDGVKSALKGGKLPTLSEFEDHLREVGFSNTEAKAVAGKGLSHLLRQREAESQGGRELKLADVLAIVKNV
jgi:hypothetical protein